MTTPWERRFTTNELGLIVPAQSERPSPRMNNLRTYLTYRDWTGLSMSQSQLLGLLEKLSAADCFASLAHIGGRLYAATDPADVQHKLVTELSGDSEPGRRLHAKLRDPRYAAIFFEQQLVHLARLVALHSDVRPHDDFGQRSLYDAWMACVLGVSDLLEHGLDLNDPTERRAWEIRQAEINSNDEQLPLWALHHEVYSVLWHEPSTPRTEAANRAFEAHVGMTIDEYFTVGSAAMAYFLNGGLADQPRAPLNPAVYFASARMSSARWRAFFGFLGRSVDELRHELRAEEANYGRTTFGALTFERFPLVELEPGLYVPTTMSSLARRLTQGVFHVLADAAVAEGLDRRHYSSAFGSVFQRSVEATFRRGVARSIPELAITADIEYRRGSNTVASSDVILGQGRNPVFVEVVSGPLQAATVTRGDSAAFDADLDRIIVRKARQLDRCIHDFLDGRLAVDGSDPQTVNRAWPVIVTSHPFPHAPYVTDYVEGRVRDAGYLTDPRIGPLAIVSAENLFFCEGFMQRGQTFLSLTRGWKSGPGGSLPFKNFLVEHGGGRAPGSDHFERRFAEANSNYMRRLLGSDVTPDEILERGRRICE